MIGLTMAIETRTFPKYRSCFARSLLYGVLSVSRGSINQALDRGPYYMLPTGTTQGQLQGHCTKPTFLPTCTGIGVVRLFDRSSISPPCSFLLLLRHFSYFLFPILIARRSFLDPTCFTCATSLKFQHEQAANVVLHLHCICFMNC